MLFSLTKIFKGSLLFLILLGHLHGEDPFDWDLEDLMEMEVTSSSLIEQKSKAVHANVTVITQQMIKARAYRNLVQVLQDIPGFDFAMGEDGGGEYTTHSLHRGIGGDNGNSKMLVMVNGVVQNFINNNWSTLWTDEMLLLHVKRIEVIHGPGSVAHGANAVSGIVHFILDEDDAALMGLVEGGENGRRRVEGRFSRPYGDNNINFAFRFDQSDGDGGDRYDPGRYFSGHNTPAILTQNYNGAGLYEESNTTGQTVAHPEAGVPLKSGFDTSHESFSIFGSVSLGPSLDFETFFWNRKQGLASYVPGYEYYANDPRKDYSVQMKGYHLSLKMDHELSEGSELTSRLVYRVTEQSPDTGFHYTYRFWNLKKSYHSFSSQSYFEETYKRQLDERGSLVLGLKLTGHQKMPQIVSLGSEQDSQADGTFSSWNTANTGGGLNQEENYQTFRSEEVSLFGMVERGLGDSFDISFGLRFDNNSQEYGSVWTPRFGLQYGWTTSQTTKFLYGEAFRQPSNFELFDEFRGNAQLQSEKIKTFELLHHLYLRENLILKGSLFYSELNEVIEVVGGGYQNSASSEIRGLMLSGDFDFGEGIKAYANGIYTEGKDRSRSWSEIEHVAKIKLNAGVDFDALGTWVHGHLRVNHVGKTRAPASNAWMWRNEGGFAPAFTKFSLVLTMKSFWKGRFQPQLTVDNLFDEDYYLLGRQDGSGDVSQYDSTSLDPSLANPAGFIPAYHPQRGRSIFLNASLRL
jgi:outer membrane receptor for ferrienterochelin and colicins